MTGTPRDLAKKHPRFTYTQEDFEQLSKQVDDEGKSMYGKRIDDVAAQLTATANNAQE